jgi:dephospho-CoA kinase
MPIKIGITGGIGSGKSTVSALLEVMGIPVYIADTASKQLTLSHPAIRKALIALLGEEVYAGNTLNKPLLANYIFSDPEHLRTVNSIIHPRVRTDFERWSAEHASSPIIGMEAAILFEAGFQDSVDVTLMVYAPEAIRLDRVMKRDAASRQAVKQRMQSQMSDEEKRTLADYTLLNDGTTPLIPQVLEVLSSLPRK